MVAVENCPAKSPPSTRRLDPVMKEAPFEAANRIAALVSETFPILPTGYCLFICFMISGPHPDFTKMGVSIEAGLFKTEQILITLINWN